ncbi:PRTRC system protein F [Methylibium sp.]|uniref:PRTRC system protein F n=1 Tax=Methylibium sp. TaxID=2067992 RepID=UPI003D0C2A5A
MTVADAQAQAPMRLPVPVLALPMLSAQVPTSVTSTQQAAANAALCRFLIEAGVVHEDDLPQSEADPLKGCERAIDAWIKRQIGPLHCLQPRFAVNVLDEHGHHPGMRDGRQTAYAQLDLYWCEYQEHEWPVGARLEALDAAMHHLGATVLQVLREQSRYVYPLFTPDIADDVASYVYWQGEPNEEAALDMMCEEGEEADREAMREEMVTRKMLDEAYPAWARRWLARPEKGLRRRTGHGGWRPCNLRRAAKTLTDPLQRQIAVDALALSRLSLDDTFRPDIDGEYIGFGAVLSWSVGDVTTRIYDDLLTLAHQAEFCDRMGEQIIPLDDPGALTAWVHRMGQRFEAIALIDRLIHALCD